MLCACDQCKRTTNCADIDLASCDMAQAFISAAAVACSDDSADDENKVAAIAPREYAMLACQSQLSAAAYWQWHRQPGEYITSTVSCLLRHLRAAGKCNVDVCNSE